MDIDPYKPPSGAPQPDQSRPRRFQLIWKAMFYLYSLFMALALVSLPQIRGFGFFDFIDFIISLIATAGIFGLAFMKPIGSVVFWRYFFYIALAESFLFSCILPIVGISRYGQSYTFSPVEPLLTLAILFALHQYAYRRADIWRNA